MKRSNESGSDGTSVPNERPSKRALLQFSTDKKHFSIDKDDFVTMSKILCRLQMEDNKMKKTILDVVKVRELDDEKRVFSVDFKHTNCLTTLPQDIVDLTNLEVMNLSYTGIKSIPSTIGQFMNLKDLRLRGARNLLVLPNEIGNLVRLECLGLSESGIKSLPSSIGQLKNLKEFWLLRTKNLSSVPEEIGGLTSLVRLSFRKSSIESLPSSIGQLKSLRKLWLSQTKNMLELPDAIGNLPNLIYLGVGGSSIRTLPLSIGDLANLQIILMHSTKIELLPDQAQKLRSLMYLNIRGTPVDISRGSGRIDYLLMLVQSCPLLGCLGMTEGSLDGQMETKLGYRLACNRANSRAKASLTPSMLPFILTNAGKAFDAYPGIPLNRFQTTIFKHSPPWEIHAADAVYYLLAGAHRESLIMLLIHRSTNHA